MAPATTPQRKKIPDGETLSVLDWVEKYRSVVPAKDIVWLLCRNEFLSDRDLRLFAVWCAREALSLIDSPDPRSVEACDVAERYANGEASQEELAAARAAAYASFCAAKAAKAAAYGAAYAASYATYAAARAAYAAARAAARAAADADAACEKQLNQLLTYFN